MKKIFFLSMVVFFIGMCENPISPSSEPEKDWEVLDSSSQEYLTVVPEISTIFYSGEKNFRSFDGEIWEQWTGFGTANIVEYSERVLYSVFYTKDKDMIFALSKDEGNNWEEIKQVEDNYYLLPAPFCLCKNKYDFCSYPLIGYFHFYRNYLSGVYGTSYPNFYWKKTGIRTVKDPNKILSRKEGIYSISYDSLAVFSWDNYWKKWQTVYMKPGRFLSLAEDTVNNQVWTEEEHFNTLMRTSDGETWENVSLDPDLEKECSGKAYFAFYKNYIFMGHSGHLISNGLIFSKDKGKTWVKDEVIPSGVNGVEIFRGYLYVATISGLFRKKL